MKLRSVLFSLLLLSAGGCSRSGPEQVLSTAELIRRWADPLQAARLDVPDTTLLSSVDPSGKNDDYNHPLRKGPEGWVVLADLEGPGYMSRFWFTGAENGQHRIRLYFDGERKPSVDTTLDGFCGGADPWRHPLAAYENYCWFNLVPIPFRKRLVVMVQEGGFKPGGWPRLFFQINFSRLPPGMTTEEFRGTYSPEVVAEILRVRDAWVAGGLAPVPDGCEARESTLTLQPGEGADGLDVAGPAMIRQLTVTPDYGPIGDAVAREKLGRQLALQVRWNDSDAPSVETPLGDFFGQVWRRVRFPSMFFTLTNDSYVSRFPMPFEKRARVRIENQSGQPVTVSVRADVQSLPAWEAGWGYLHAHWSRTTAQDVGKPHPILLAEGAGKYVGCILAVMSEDRSWWILEGDEQMYADGAAAPKWRGTGLEDYFNGGWYYQNVIARPLHGVPFKSFFRVVQYRLHLLDATKFGKSFRMDFERGPDQASRGAMESVAWYYLAAPAAAGSALGTALGRTPPRDPLAEATVMNELLNYERFGDYRGAREYIEAFLQMHSKFPKAALLRLRELAYRERLEGFDVVRPEYERFAAEETDPEAVEQAKLLLWFHEDPSHVLVSLSSTAPARALLDGQEAVTAGRPERAVVKGATAGPGRHALALHTLWSPYPSWLQAAVRTHEGLVVTSPDWKYKFRPAESWGATDYDDSGWPAVGGTGTKGPPEEPFIWMEPNGFVDLQSQAVGLRANDEVWPDKRGFFVFRRVFERP
ncbi:MAG TPA: DUF2961 domain-containing protein [Kiritimatiellia bacterium]|nr:DUF2961 domain-containing protein [Kiritimatiellia bacterium]HRZ11905.1 DUF2961 domain-containing protein [Kiritimatiellia bacterium]HSA17289.1 DUF2961 domain-containing protein [Kiritimatiellia bacterium]